LPFYSELFNYHTVFTFLLIAAGFTKSAQIPFSAWLPAAIAAPTPVSSLVHSSTLVTAGVYLLFRHCQYSNLTSPLYLVIFIGITTIIIASLSALNEKDIKKIVALSTLSQLGLIITRLGSKFIFIGFFHLITHAFFKAIIFIRVGNIIHHSQLYQTLKNRGNIINSSPFNSSALITATFSLCGAPFAAAFFSKEPIAEIYFYTSTSTGILLFMLFSLAITVIYRARLIKIILLSFSNLQPNWYIRERDYLLRKGVVILSAPSFSRGLLLRRLIITTPSSFIYCSSTKLIIFSFFILFFVIFSLPKFIINYLGRFYVFTLYRLGLFSRGLWLFHLQYLSFNSNTSSFGFYLNGLTSALHLN
jgi:NADH-ubiquinone oxidoreductase chain 5